jgi:hypothetical protein
MHPASTSTGSSTRSPARFLGAIIFGLVIAGSAAFGVQTLLAAPASTCPTTDPIEICTLGGTPLCEQCCMEFQQSGECFGGVCICTD